MRSQNNRYVRARGAALVIALLVVAMVVMLATALSSDFLLMFRRVENQIYSEQAYAYLYGAEGLARAALLQDLQNDGKKLSDNLQEPWAQEQRFPTDYGWIMGRIEDLQGRFNINSLASAAAQQGAQTTDYTAAQEQLIRLLQSLVLEKPLALDQAQALTEAITDWVDSNDDVSGLGGAESQYYAQADPMGRPANRAIASPSELMWVKGMTPEIYRALAPLITVWPAIGTMNINLNTAPPLVLRCLGASKDLQPLSDSEADFLVQEIKAHPLQDSQDLVQLFSTGVLQGKKIDTSSLSVGSEYFVLNAQTEFQGHRYSLHSLLHRDAGKRTVRVEARTFGEW